MTASPEDGEKAKVGYKHPPKETQFKPGKSGNARGRPKTKSGQPSPRSRKKLLQILYEEASRLVDVSEGDSRKTMPWTQVFIRSIGSASLKDAQFLKVFLPLLLEAEKLTNEESVIDLSLLNDDELMQLRALQSKALKPGEK